MVQITRHSTVECSDLGEPSLAALTSPVSPRHQAQLPSAPAPRNGTNEPGEMAQTCNAGTGQTEDHSECEANLGYMSSKQAWDAQGDCGKTRSTKS